MNIDAKIFNEIREISKIQQYTKKGLYTMIKWDLTQECKDGLTSANKCDTH